MTETGESLDDKVLFDNLSIVSAPTFLTKVLWMAGWFPVNASYNGDFNLGCKS